MNSIIPRASLSEALSKVEKIEQLIESGIAMDEARIHVLGEISEMPIDKATGLSDAIDRYIAVWQAFEAKEQHLKELAAKIRARRASLKGAFENFKERLVGYISDNPQIEFRGSEQGFRMKVNGGKAKMSLNFEPYKIENLVTSEQIEEFEIPEDCYREITVRQLDNDKLRKFMQGETDKKTRILTKRGTFIEGSSSFGSLERGQRLEIE